MINLIIIWLFICCTAYNKIVKEYNTQPNVSYNALNKSSASIKQSKDQLINYWVDLQLIPLAQSTVNLCSMINTIDIINSNNRLKKYI